MSAMPHGKRNERNRTVFERLLLKAVDGVTSAAGRHTIY